MKTVATVALIAMSTLSSAYADPVELSTFIALPRPTPTTVIEYGPSTSQAVDLFLPKKNGPHPLAILIHGGCWSATAAGREQLRHMGAALAERGIAVWSIGYRRANEAGGGYPGTFEDVAVAIDRARSDAARYDLDLSRAVVVGHSAGGHLALWASARDRLHEDSRLYRAQPFMPGSVISLAGIGDLESFARNIPIICGPDILERLTPQSDVASRYGEISPAALPPPRGDIVMISGILDRLVPPYAAHDYARAMRKQRVDVRLVDIPGAGHFDLVTPGTTAWADVIAHIEAALGSHDR